MVSNPDFGSRIPVPPNSSFTAPVTTISVNGLLFDFDGTIIDSTPAVEKYWHIQADELGVPAADILASSHGRRSIDIFRIWDKSGTKANWEYISEAEGRIPADFGSDAQEIPGARKLLAELDEKGAKWAVVTSGTKALIDGWLKVLDLARPKRVVTAEDVKEGKPNPEGYLMGMEKLGLAKAVVDEGNREERHRIVVLEDAPSGVKAGKAAGFQVIGLATTHAIEKVREAGADWIVRDLRSVRCVGVEGDEVHIEIEGALEETTNEKEEVGELVAEKGVEGASGAEKRKIDEFEGPEANGVEGQVEEEDEEEYDEEEEDEQDQDEDEDDEDAYEEDEEDPDEYKPNKRQKR